jgi:hypothetical protein
MLVYLGEGCVGGEKECNDMCRLAERPFYACADVGSGGAAWGCGRMCFVGLGVGAGVSQTGLEFRVVEVLTREVR